LKRLRMNTPRSVLLARTAARICVVAVSGVVWMLPIEIGARYWIKHFGDPLDRCMLILERDPVLGWRQRAGLRGRFLGVPLETSEIGLRNPVAVNTPAGARHVLILGPSSTFGWGVPEEATYARRLEGLLQARDPERPVSVTNAGQIGYSSWQGVAFYRETARSLRPDIVVLAYGANDVDRHRFFLQDQQPDHVSLSRPQPAWAVAWRNRLLRLSFIHVASRQLSKILQDVPCMLGMGAHASQAAVPPLRVPPERFKANLRKLVTLAHEDKAAVILMTTGFRLPDAASAGRREKQEARLKLAQGLESFEKGKYPLAAQTLSAALEADPGLCEAYYALSRSQQALKDCRAANANRLKAQAHEPSRIGRDLRAYNRLARQIAEESGVPVLDLQQSWSSTGNEKYFLDPIHFSVEGHRQIARELAQIIEGRGLLTSPRD